MLLFLYILVYVHMMADVKIEKEEVLSEDVAKMNIDNDEPALSRVKKIKSERAGFLMDDDSNSGEIAGDILGGYYSGSVVIAFVVCMTFFFLIQICLKM